MTEDEIITPVPDNTSAPSRISQMERFTFGSAQFADMGGPQLVSTLRDAERGDMRSWGNLGDHILSGSDQWLGGKFRARAMRVAQANYHLVPVGNTRASELAAELCDQGIRRLPRLVQTFMRMLDAIPMGANFHHQTWGRFGQNYLPNELSWVHLRRMRYDLQWKARLWDGGSVAGPDGYGRMLDSEPGQWIQHYHETRGTYPGLYGELRGCTKLWLFMNWCQVWWVQNSEKYGSAFIYATMPKDAKAETRAKVKAGLQALANDHVGFVEEGSEISVEVAAAASRAFENFSEFVAFAKATLTEQVLGTADAAGPGDNGSNAAVSTRMGAMTDPIMIMDGAELAETLRSDMLKWIVYFNRHRLSDNGVLPETPEFKFLTAGDEVTVDKTDRVQEVSDAVDAGDVSRPDTSGEGTPPVQASREVAEPHHPLAVALRARQRP